MLQELLPLTLGQCQPLYTTAEKVTILFQEPGQTGRHEQKTGKGGQKPNAPTYHDERERSLTSSDARNVT